MKKVNCVIACWAGDRRNKDPEDKTEYIKWQLKSLKAYKHSLAQITFVIAASDVEPEYYSEFIKTLPTTLQNTPVKIIRRENKGQSYGSYSDCYKKYRDAFDYYIFIEDDYIFVQDNFDASLVSIFESHNNCGYLCSLVYGNHAAISNGITSSKILKLVWDKYGELPSDNSHGLLPPDVVSGDIPYGSDPQLSFSASFLASGTKLIDCIPQYEATFFSTDKEGRVSFRFWDQNRGIIGSPDRPRGDVSKNLLIPIQLLKYPLPEGLNKIRERINI